MDSGMVEVDTVTLGGASPSGSLRGVLCIPGTSTMPDGAGEPAPAVVEA